MSITSRFFVQFTVALLIVGLLALLSIVGMTIWLGERAQVYFNDVIEARDTRASAVELRSAVQTAESSQRGYLLTGNEIYLAPYGPAKSRAQRQLEALRSGIAAYPETKIAFDRLITILNEKFGEMDETIALKRGRRDAEVLAIVRTNRGKGLTDEANVFFAGVIGAADERLTRGVGEQRTNAATLRWVSLVSGIIIIFVVGGVVATVRQYTRELARARDEVGLLNTGLEKRVRDRTADLSQANDEIQRFAYIVTHDLRAPLVNIMGFTSELEGSIKNLQELIEASAAGGAPSETVASRARLATTVDMPEAISFIRSSTKKMDNLINAILKLSREGRRNLNAERVELADVVKASIAAIQHQLSEADGEISLDLNVPALTTDKVSLEQVFANLLDNAVKYRSKQRPLRIEVRARPAADGQIAVEVADNGRGISEQDLERVFELFRRSGVQDEPGEGIGLAHVRALVRSLGGDISVTSILNEGSTFRLVLPHQLQSVRSSG